MHRQSPPPIFFWGTLLPSWSTFVFCLSCLPDTASPRPRSSAAGRSRPDSTSPTRPACGRPSLCRSPTSRTIGLGSRVRQPRRHFRALLSRIPWRSTIIIFRSVWVARYCAPCAIPRAHAVCPTWCQRSSMLIGACNHHCYPYFRCCPRIGVSGDCNTKDPSGCFGERCQHCKPSQQKQHEHPPSAHTGTPRNSKNGLRPSFSPVHLIISCPDPRARRARTLTRVILIGFPQTAATARRQ